MPRKELLDKFNDFLSTKEYIVLDDTSVKNCICIQKQATGVIRFVHPKIYIPKLILDKKYTDMQHFYDIVIPFIYFLEDEMSFEKNIEPDDQLKLWKTYINFAEQIYTIQGVSILFCREFPVKNSKYTLVCHDESNIINAVYINETKKLIKKLFHHKSVTFYEDTGRIEIVNLCEDEYVSISPKSSKDFMFDKDFTLGIYKYLEEANMYNLRDWEVLMLFDTSRILKKRLKINNNDLISTSILKNYKVLNCILNDLNTELLDTTQHYNSKWYEIDEIKSAFPINVEYILKYVNNIESQSISLQQFIYNIFLSICKPIHVNEYP